MPVFIGPHYHGLTPLAFIDWDWRLQPIGSHSPEPVIAIAEGPHLDKRLVRHWAGSASVAY